MRNLIALAILAVSARPLFGQINFSDNFSNGISPTYWTVAEDPSNGFTVDTSGGNIAVAAKTTGQGYQLNFNTTAVGLPTNYTGDFSATMSFSNADMTAPPPNTSSGTVNFFAAFSTGLDEFGESYRLFSTGPYTQASAIGVPGVPNFSGNGTAVSGTSGTFTLSRTGSTVSGYFDGNLLYSVPNSGPLSQLSFSLENQSTTDPNSVDFTNFTFTAPEPGSLAILLFAIPALGVRRRCPSS